jgi:hypothetical protein
MDAADGCAGGRVIRIDAGLRYARGGWSAGAGPILRMTQLSLREWQIAGAAAGVMLAAGAAVWMLRRKRPTADELELARRQMLFSFGRIVDGLLLDGFDVTADDGTTRHMLLYQYEISGVVYECSQDVTTLQPALDPAQVKLGMPCSIRYQPGSPENSILVSERWSGLREGLPMVWPPMEAPAHRYHDGSESPAGSQAELF